MASLAETVNYDSGVYQLEVTDPVQGGASGISNAPQKNLANRTAYLKQHVDALEAAAAGYATLASPTFTGTPAAPTPAAGDSSTKLATTAFAAGLAGGVLTKSVAGGSNVTLSATEAGNGIYIFTGALTASISVIIPANGKRVVVSNQTTGSFVLTVKTASGTGTAVRQGTNRPLWCDGVNVYPSLSDFTDAALVGTPTTPTPTTGDSSTKIASTAFAMTAAAAAAGTVSGGRLLNVRTFAGSTTYTPSAGTNTIDVFVQGGGGGGGGAAPTDGSSCAAGAGGGGGGWAIRRMSAAGMAGTAITIGSGGAGGGAGAAGTSGGTTSYGSFVGGYGGAGGAGGAAIPNTAVTVNGSGPGGVGYNGDRNGMGGIGRYAIFVGGVPTSGDGGYSFFGAGGVWVTGTSSGYAGNVWGSGGGGAAVQSGVSTGGGGGGGGAGVCIIWEYT